MTVQVRWAPGAKTDARGGHALRPYESGPARRRHGRDGSRGGALPDCFARFAAAPLELARFHNENGKNAEAEQVLREALKNSPEQGEVYYSLGLLLAEEQRLEEAEVYLRQAAQAPPKNLPPSPPIVHNSKILHIQFVRLLLN